MNTSVETKGANEAAPSAWGPYAAALAILLAGGMAYADSFHGPFVFDDLPTIVENASVRQLWELRAVLSPPAASATARRPLVNLSFAINYALGGLDVVGYHAFNLAVHLLAALTLFGVVRRSLLLSGSKLALKSTALAAIVALVWAVHPLDTEAVTYITQRTESLASLFYLLTLYTAIRGATSDRSLPWRAVSVAACLAGMACNEVVLSAPLIVLLYDRIFLSSSFREIRVRRGGFYLALAATWLLPAWIAFGAGARGASPDVGQTIGMGEFAATQLVAIPHYLQLCFWPRPLVFDYGADVITAPAQVAPPALSTALLIAATLLGLRFYPRLGFLGVCFFALLAPSSSFFPADTQTIAEHRMYLALAAVATLAVLGGAWLFEKLLDRLTRPEVRQMRLTLAIVAAGTIVLLLVYQTLERNRDYRSGLALWQDTVDKRPNLARAHSALAAEYLQPANLNASEAIREATRAIELHPDAGAYLNRGNAYLIRGRDAEALADFTRSIELKSEFAPSYYNRGSALLHLGRLEESLADFDRAIDLAPQFGAAYLQRGGVHLLLEQYESALADFNRAIEIDPRAGDAYFNRAQCRFALKQYDLARRDAMLSRELGVKVEEEFFKKLSEAALEAR